MSKRLELPSKSRRWMMRWLLCWVLSHAAELTEELLGKASCQHPCIPGWRRTWGAQKLTSTVSLRSCTTRTSTHGPRQASSSWTWWPLGVMTQGTSPCPRNWFQELFGNHSEQTVLEVGAHLGHCTRVLSRLFGTVLALEHSPHVLKENARRNADLKNVAPRT